MTAQLIGKDTQSDMMRLQTYGAMYMGGIDPIRIERVYDQPAMQLLNLQGAIASVAGEPSMEYERASSAVRTAFNATAGIVSSTTAIVSAVSGAVAGASQVGGPIVGAVGAAASAVISIVGGIISAVLSKQSSIECDSEDCLERGGTQYNEGNHRRAIIGVDPPPGADPYSTWSCIIKHWGGTKGHCKARWGYFVEYMNDGSWVYKIPDGTVIGVRGRVKNFRVVPFCNEHKYCGPYFPKEAGVKKCITPTGRPAVLQDGTTGVAWSTWSAKTYPNAKREPWPVNPDMPAAIQQRELAVNDVLAWLQNNMSYEVLSCYNRMLYNLTNMQKDYRVCTGETCNERSIAHLMGSKDNYFNFGTDVGNQRAILMSRVYASIRAHFEGLVQMASVYESIRGERQLRLMLNSAGAGLAIDPIVAAVKNPGRATGPWPEKNIANRMKWKTLKEVMWRLSDEIIKAQAAGASTAGTMTVRAPFSEATWKKHIRALQRWNLTTTHYVLIGGGILVLGGAIAYATKGGK